jgi:hypothetical protein
MNDFILLIVKQRAKEARSPVGQNPEIRAPLVRPLIHPSLGAAKVN